MERVVRQQDCHAILCDDAKALEIMRDRGDDIRQVAVCPGSVLVNDNRLVGPIGDVVQDDVIEVGSCWPRSKTPTRS